MMVDNNLILSGSVSSTGTIAFQTVTGAANSQTISTNCLDLGIARDIAEGQPLYVRLAIGATFGGSSSVVAGPTQVMVEAISSDDSAQTVNVTSRVADYINCNPTYTGTSITTGGVVTWPNHGLGLNQAQSNWIPVVFTSLTGGTGLSASTVYYVIPSSITANTFQVAATVGGTAILPSAAATAFTAFASMMQAGNRYVLSLDPMIFSKTQEFLALRYTILGATGSTGSIFADVGIEVADANALNKAYPVGFTVK